MTAATSLTWNQVRAIVWAQWRALWNRVPGARRGSTVLTGIIATAWYAGVVALAVGAAFLMADSSLSDKLTLLVSGALFLMFLYWQFAPIVMASTGTSLDLKRLLVYPAPRDALYGLEVLLRVTTGVEILILLTGATIGSFFNRALPYWSALGFLLYVVFNLLLAAGVRDLMVRLFAKKHVRELTVLLMVMVAALPQFLALSGAAAKVKGALAYVPASGLPWQAAAQIASGQRSWLPAAILCCWIGLALVFGRWQFERSISVDVEGAIDESPAATGRQRFAFLPTWPSRLFRDPVAALVEKEIRTLSRASRFRVVFVMGFTFGLFIWIPISLGSGHSPDSFARRNFLVLVCAYAVMLLSDLLFFNSFGPDCGAVQVYFVIPVRLDRVIFARNVSALFFVLADLSIVVAVCTVLRLSFRPISVAEAFSVCIVLCTFLIAIGNIASVWNPRPVNMTQSFRSRGASRVQWMALVAFPAACAPVALAYLARFAFDTEAAFFGVLAVFEVLGVYVYKMALESAVHRAERSREQIIESLGRSAGVLST